jgi:hypothetical protein
VATSVLQEPQDSQKGGAKACRRRSLATGFDGDWRGGNGSLPQPITAQLYTTTEAIDQCARCSTRRRFERGERAARRCTTNVATSSAHFMLSAMSAAICARKSTDHYGIADHAKSVTRQIEHAKAYAAPEGWTLPDCIFVNDGISGAKFANRLVSCG